jgi:hypothetical protein
LSHSIFDEQLHEFYYWSRYLYILYAYILAEILRGADTRLTGNDGTTLPAFNLRLDKNFGIYTIIYYFDSRPKTRYVSRLRLVGNIVAEDKKLDVEYLLHSQ